MSKDVFDDDLDNHFKEEEFECLLCGKAIDHEGYCSSKCYNIDN